METIMKIEYTAMGIIIGMFIAMCVLVNTIELEGLKTLPTKESCVELIKSLD